MPYLEGIWFTSDCIDAARDELHEIRKERAAWVRETHAGRRYCGLCSMDYDLDAVSIVVSPGTVCDGCGERAP